RLDRGAAQKLHPWIGEQKLIDFGGRRQATARSERATVESGDRVRIPERVLDLAVRRPEACRGEGTAKRIPRPGAVDAVDRKRRCPNFPPVAPRDTAFGSEGYADEPRAEITAHRLERFSELFVSRQRSRKFFLRDDDVHVLPEVGAA